MCYLASLLSLDTVILPDSALEATGGYVVFYVVFFDFIDDFI